MAMYIKTDSKVMSLGIERNEAKTNPTKNPSG
jgi:hypothetical protein